jgi:hypothetical protein
VTTLGTFSPVIELYNWWWKALNAMRFHTGRGSEWMHSFAGWLGITTRPLHGGGNMVGKAGREVRWFLCMRLVSASAPVRLLLCFPQHYPTRIIGSLTDDGLVVAWFAGRSLLRLGSGLCGPPGTNMDLHSPVRLSAGFSDPRAPASSCPSRSAERWVSCGASERDPVSPARST